MYHLFADIARVTSESVSDGNLLDVGTFLDSANWYNCDLPSFLMGFCPGAMKMSEVFLIYISRKTYLLFSIDHVTVYH